MDREDDFDYDGFRFFHGLIVTLCLTACMVALGLTIAEIFTWTN